MRSHGGGRVFSFDSGAGGIRAGRYGASRRIASAAGECRAAPRTRSWRRPAANGTLRCVKLLVVIAVGLRPKDLAHAPVLRGLGEHGFAAPLDTVFPAVTCSVQATFLTGLLPSGHGAVGNGWYFRDLAQVMFWRQQNQLVHGEKLYQAAARRGARTAKLFWWWNMHAPDVAWSVTPRPEYHADGLKKPGLYSEPPLLQRELQDELGPFPLFDFWGPKAGIASTRWIAASALSVLRRHDPDLLLVYLPHLDYDHQRHGPDDARSVQAVRDLDAECARLVAAARERDAHVVVLSEYGIEAATAPVFVNRLLHERGYLRVQETSHGQLLDAGASRAFAVADHQCAHVYVRDAADLQPVRSLLTGLDGVERVFDRAQQRELGLDHERSGELVAVAAPGRWFAYPYWLDEARRPDFAPTVDIHRKPGYDPAELFLDPKLRFPRLRIATRLARKLLGFRYLMDVIPTDPSLVRGTHGRLYGDDALGPVFLCSDRRLARDRVAATDVKALCLRLLGG
ncbi:MAG: alkaline phosphatase family protein [Planctomycetes bacterium]|nr:alkaline phosphatase family protein [Planctomycetota bacterium]